MIPEVKRRIEQIQQGNMPEGYKKTSSGIAAVEWTDTCLGEIYTERKEPGNETLPLLMVSIHSGVSDGEVDEDDLPKKVKRIEDKSQYKRAATGDLVFNMMRAWQGAIGTVRTEGMVSPAYIVAEPNNMVAPLFMDYYMKTNRMVNTIHRQSYGVTDFRLRLYWDSFAPIRCVLPPVAEQQKIAAILTTQDKVIELKEKRLAEKQRQKKYLMQQLLTGKRRLPGFDEEWTTIRLGQWGDCIRGVTYAPEVDLFPAQCSQSIRLYRANNIINGQMNNNDVQYVDAKRVNQVQTLQEGDIVLSMSSGSRAAVGKSALVRIVDTVSCVGAFCAIYRSPQAPYVNQLLSSSMFDRQLAIILEGSNINNLKNQDIEGLVFPIPYNLEERMRIQSILNCMDSEINLLRKDIEQEQQKKKALMQLLLTGIVRVNNGK